MRYMFVLCFGSGWILLMDDDVDICCLVGGMFGSLEYKYDIVKNGEEVIVFYCCYLKIGKLYDVVVFDLIVVGGFGGEDIFCEFCVFDLDVCVVVCIGYDSEEMVVELFE